jgi:predicted DCC family thiol-disulfide oxidoreductase YuxK
MNKQPIILFDGVCKLCNGWAKFIMRVDKDYRFKLCSVQSEQGQALLREYGYPQDHFETMLLIADGNAYQKSWAFLFIMKKLGLPFSLLYVLKFIPAFIRDWCYDRIALNRYRLFGKYESCPINFDLDEKRFLL